MPKVWGVQEEHYGASGNVQEGGVWFRVLSLTLLPGGQGRFRSMRGAPWSCTWGKQIGWFTPSLPGGALSPLHVSSALVQVQSLVSGH